MADRIELHDGTVLHERPSPHGGTYLYDERGALWPYDRLVAALADEAKARAAAAAPGLNLLALRVALEEAVAREEALEEVARAAVRTIRPNQLQEEFADSMAALESTLDRARALRAFKEE